MMNATAKSGGVYLYANQQASSLLVPFLMLVPRWALLVHAEWPAVAAGLFIVCWRRRGARLCSAPA